MVRAGGGGGGAKTKKNYPHCRILCAGLLKKRLTPGDNLAKTKGMAPVGFHKGKKMTHTPVEKGNQEGKVEQKCTEVIRAAARRST